MKYPIILVIWAFTWLDCSAHQDPIGVGQRSQFNNKAVQVDSTGNYSFIVGGHFYGSSATNSGFPASTVLGGLDRMVAFNPNMLFVTGDLFLDLDRDKENYNNALFNKLPCPIFNAVGNHDLDGDNYGPYGPRYFYFFVNKDLFVVLDTELDNGSIKGEQLNMLKQGLNEASSKGANNIFLISHRPVWAIGHQDLDGLLKQNTRSLMGNNFNKDIRPLLVEHTNNTEVFWFAGSMGGSAPASFLYHEEHGLHYIITAIRDTRRDAVLGVQVGVDGVDFTTLALGQSKVQELATYNLEYWQERVGRSEGFNFKLIPYYIKSIVTHRAFWSGILLCTVLFLLWRVFKKNSN